MLEPVEVLSDDPERLYAGEGLVSSLYRLMEHPLAGQINYHDQPLRVYALDEQWSVAQVAQALHQTNQYIPPGNRAVISLVFSEDDAAET